MTGVSILNDSMPLRPEISPAAAPPSFLDTAVPIRVRGADLPCSDNRAESAVTLVFLHGAVTDLRMWHRHRAIIGMRYRTIACTQRYHGHGAWQADWPPYGVKTHADDLVACLDQIDAGPVHLVAWSYAGQVAFQAALQRPELFRGLFVYEPGVPGHVDDPQAMARWQADAEAAFGPVFEAAMRADFVGAMKRMLDASSPSPGVFDRQDPASQRIQLDNARTMELLLLRQEAPPMIPSDELARLPGLGVAACIAYGLASRPLQTIPAQAAQQCLGGTGHLAVPGQDHLWPDTDPAAFTQAVLDFVARS